MYDHRVRSAALESGERVLVKKLAFEGKHKIDDRWENPVYIVVDQPNPDIPVYRVRQEEDEKARYRTLHRNHLLAIGSLPVDESSETPKFGGGEKDEPEDVSEMSDDGTADEVDHFPSLAGSGDVNGPRIDDTVVGKCDDSSGMEMVQTNEMVETNEMVSDDTGDDSEMIEVVPKDDDIEENEMVDDAIEGDVPLLEWKYPGEPEVNEVPELMQRLMQRSMQRLIQCLVQSRIQCVASHGVQTARGDHCGASTAESFSALFPASSRLNQPGQRPGPSFPLSICRYLPPIGCQDPHSN